MQKKNHQQNIRIVGLILKREHICNDRIDVAQTEWRWHKFKKGKVITAKKMYD